MKHSHSTTILLVIIPALASAAPWFKRESPASSISDNAVSTSEVAAGSTTEVYTSTTELALSTIALTTSSTETYASSTATSDVYSSATEASVTEASGTSAQPSATAGTPTLCGADSLPTLKGQAMLITAKNVVVEWGPDPKIQDGQAAPFMFPLYCGSTNFTAHIFEPDADHSNLESAKDHKICTVTGGEVLTETPLLVVNVQDVAPFFGIVDLGLSHGLEFSPECGDVLKTPGACEAPKDPQASLISTVAATSTSITAAGYGAAEPSESTSVGGGETTASVTGESTTASSVSTTESSLSEVAAGASTATEVSTTASSTTASSTTASSTTASSTTASATETSTTASSTTEVSSTSQVSTTEVTTTSEVATSTTSSAEPSCTTYDITDGEVDNGKRCADA